MEVERDWDIEDCRTKFESEEHWNLKKEFLLAHKEKFNKCRLVCLAQIFVNIQLMRCSYPEQIMRQMSELSKGIGLDYKSKQKDRLQRTFVKASDAANSKVKGLIPNFSKLTCGEIKLNNYQKEVSESITLNSSEEKYSKFDSVVILNDTVDSPKNEDNAENNDEVIILDQYSESLKETPIILNSSFVPLKVSSVSKNILSENYHNNSESDKYSNLPDSSNLASETKLDNDQQEISKKITLNPLQEKIKNDLKVDSTTVPSITIDSPEMECKNTENYDDDDDILILTQYPSSLGANSDMSLNSLVPLQVTSSTHNSETGRKELSNDVAKDYESQQKGILPDTSYASKAFNRKEETSYCSGFGAKILKLMGWTGGGLGKNEDGIKEPVSMPLPMGRTGLGLLAMSKLSNEQKEIFRLYPELVLNHAAELTKCLNEKNKKNPKEKFQNIFVKASDPASVVDKTKLEKHEKESGMSNEHIERYPLKNKKLSGMSSEYFEKYFCENKKLSEMSTEYFNKYFSENRILIEPTKKSNNKIKIRNGPKIDFNTVPNVINNISIEPKKKKKNKKKKFNIDCNIVSNDINKEPPKKKVKNSQNSNEIQFLNKIFENQFGNVLNKDSKNRSEKNVIKKDSENENENIVLNIDSENDIENEFLNNSFKNERENDILNKDYNKGKENNVLNTYCENKASKKEEENNILYKDFKNGKGNVLNNNSQNESEDHILNKDSKNENGNEIILIKDFENVNENNMLNKDSKNENVEIVLMKNFENGSGNNFLNKDYKNENAEIILIKDSENESDNNVLKEDSKNENGNENIIQIKDFENMSENNILSKDLKNRNEDEIILIDDTKNVSESNILNKDNENENENIIFIKDSEKEDGSEIFLLDYCETVNENNILNKDSKNENVSSKIILIEDSEKVTDNNIVSKDSKNENRSEIILIQDSKNASENNILKKDFNNENESKIILIKDFENVGENNVLNKDSKNENWGEIIQGKDSINVSVNGILNKGSIIRNRNENIILNQDSKIASENNILKKDFENENEREIILIKDSKNMNETNVLNKDSKSRNKNEMVLIKDFENVNENNILIKDSENGHDNKVLSNDCVLLKTNLDTSLNSFVSPQIDFEINKIHWETLKHAATQSLFAEEYGSDELLVSNIYVLLRHFNGVQVLSSILNNSLNYSNVKLRANKIQFGNTQGHIFTTRVNGQLLKLGEAYDPDENVSRKKAIVDSIENLLKKCYTLQTIRKKVIDRSLCINNLKMIPLNELNEDTLYSPGVSSQIGNGLLNLPEEKLLSPTFKNKIKIILDEMRRKLNSFSPEDIVNDFVLPYDLPHVQRNYIIEQVNRKYNEMKCVNTIYGQSLFTIIKAVRSPKSIIREALLQGGITASHKVYKPGTLTINDLVRNLL